MQIHEFSFATNNPTFINLLHCCSDALSSFLLLKLMYCIGVHLYYIKQQFMYLTVLVFLIPLHISLLKISALEKEMQSIEEQLSALHGLRPGRT